MNECPEHYGWQQDGTECSTCLKQNEQVITVAIEQLGRILSYYKHNDGCQHLGCRSKSEKCCPCTCGRSNIRNVIELLQERHQR